MRYKFLALFVFLATILLPVAAFAQGYRPADRWQDIDRAKYPACYAAHDARLASYERQIGYVRTELADNEIEIRTVQVRALPHEPTLAGLLALRTELGREIARLEAERPIVERRSTTLLRICQRRVDQAKAKSKPIKKITIGPRSTGTRYVTPKTRSSGSRYVTTGRGSGSRYVSTGRGIGSRYVTPKTTRGIGSRGIGSRGIGSRGIGSRGIGSRGTGSRGIGSRCHHQPGTSRTHCGGG